VSATSFKRSQGELSIDVAEHRSIVETNRRTTPVLVPHPKKVLNSLKRVFCFYCVRLSKNNNKKSYPRFSFTPKTGMPFPKTDFLFSLWFGQDTQHPSYKLVEFVTGILSTCTDYLSSDKNF